MPTALTRTRLPAVLLAAGLALTACGDDGSSDQASASNGDAAGGSARVTMERSSFEPDELSVEPGTTVEFANLDPFDHTVTAKPSSPVDFDSGDLGEDETFEQTFDEPGTYDYFCEIHPTMRATVVVE